MSKIESILLGTAQDSGLPQVGCAKDCCKQALSDPTKRKYAVCLGVADHTTQQTWLIDATPDFPEQFAALHSRYPDYELAGILLTHAHIGHYTGLMYLGREAMSSQNIPVYASQQMANFLYLNAPWSRLIEDRNIRLHILTPDEDFNLTPNLQVTPLSVPHRDEFSDTLAFIVRSPQRSLFYCPDIDSWNEWGRDLRTFIETLDVALLDATFYDSDELLDRDISEIPHPYAVDTAQRLAGVDCLVYLIHLNHTNPLHNPGEQRRELAAKGISVGNFGMVWEL